MDIRRRVHVSKTSTDKYSWEVTVEMTGPLGEWQSHMATDINLGSIELELAAVEATNEIKRQIADAAKSDE